MKASDKAYFSTALTLGIIFFTIYIIHHFIPSLVWAGIIAGATYPLYKRWRSFCCKYDNLAALTFTALLALLFVLPFSWLISLLIKESQLFINYVQLLNKEGGLAPAFFQTIPVVGTELVRFWDDYIGQPGYLVKGVTHLDLTLSPIGYYMKHIGLSLAHRSFQVGFTLLTLFFFYRDGEKLYKTINHIGERCLDERWARYMGRLPASLRGTVNGTILVGLAVGICMGVCYALLNFPTPTLTGFITAFAAMIPFVVPLVFFMVALIFLVSGKAIAALIVVIWGTIVMFVADHFVKPVLIGGAIELPFLAVLFGILGGLETLGILGLFVGPIVMVMFITLSQELQNLPLLGSKND